MAARTVANLGLAAVTFRFVRLRQEDSYIMKTLFRFDGEYRSGWHPVPGRPISFSIKFEVLDIVR